MVPLTQWRLGLYAQDTFKLATRLTLTAGLRYAFQTTPNSFGNFGPRVGFSWAADKKETWVFHLRAGLFDNSPTNLIYAAEVYRLNGTRQRETTVYSPSYSNPLTPVAGSIQVSTVNQFPHSSLAQLSSFVAYFSVEHDFLHHWHAQGNLYFGEDYNGVRIRNMNAPMVPSSIGVPPDPIAALLAPRPIAPNENIFQYQNSCHLGGNNVSFSLDQQDYKWFGLSARYVHLNFKANIADNPLSPQSSYGNEGDSARVDWLSANNVTMFGNLNLPYGIELSTQFDRSSGHPYDITTGTDNNGDGNFNDRPSYTSSSATGSGVYSTQFGLLTSNTVNGNVPRNLGTMPATMHLDTDLSLAFIINLKDKDHPRTLTFNARSA